MIRPLKPQDIEACRTIYNYYVEHTVISFEETPLTIEQFAAMTEAVTAEYPWIVYEEEGIIKGYACLSPFNSKSAYRVSADVTIYIDPFERGKGYGRQLMKELMKRAESCGIRTLISLVTDGNTPSERLHESFGFTKAAVLKNVGYKFDTWLNVAYYIRDIIAWDPEISQ